MSIFLEICFKGADGRRCEYTVARRYGGLHRCRRETSFIQELNRVIYVCSESLLYVHFSISVKWVYLKPVMTSLDRLSKRFSSIVIMHDTDASLNGAEPLNAKVLTNSCVLFILLAVFDPRVWLRWFPVLNQRQVHANVSSRASNGFAHYMYRMRASSSALAEPGASIPCKSGTFAAIKLIILAGLLTAGRNCSPMRSCL